MTHTEHLPPSGWSDVVRLKDLEALEKRLDMRITSLDTQTNLRFQNLEDRMNSLAGSMRLLIGITLPSAIAIAGIFIQTLV